MQIVDLFSGIGGFSLAGNWIGWKTIQFVEINTFCQKILKYYWPNVPICNDIKTFSIETLKKSSWNPKESTIVVGGFPCQPYSQAGKRQGKNDERHLWPEMLRAIREIQPKWVVGENVRGLITWNEGMVFDEVQTDLETEGYEVLPFLLPAAGVNAPHERYRVWFIAYNPNTRIENLQYGRENRIYEPEFIAHTASDRWERQRQGIEIEKRLQQRPKTTGKLAGRFEGLCSNEHTSNTENVGFQGSIETNGGKRTKSNDKQFNGCSRKWDDAWLEWPTQSPICSRNDGISFKLDGITFSKWRNESIKAYGNAIVPQVAFQIFKVIEEYEYLNGI